MANNLVFLSDLQDGCSFSSVQVRLLRFWEARNVRRGGELMGVDMLLLDSQVEQMHKIFKLVDHLRGVLDKIEIAHATIFKLQHQHKRCLADTYKDLIPSSALALLDVLLAVEPKARGTTSSALQSEVLTYELF
ncbi:hypothetical protein Bca52824_028786 [Brassica carinata]|uniref:Uncharacterized protein n=1 Tax=Brassica carinata TaxID=52824 RepID=A0A8X8AQQ4_BRACI|nr:hypothetical protein Bca52824_028786 [Brassica carinata]